MEIYTNSNYLEIERFFFNLLFSSYSQYEKADRQTDKEIAWQTQTGKQKKIFEIIFLDTKI